MILVSAIQPTPTSFFKADPLRSAPHVYQQSSRRLDVVVCSLGARQRCRETQVSQYHVFMGRQTASQNHRDAHVHDRRTTEPWPAYGGPTRRKPGTDIFTRALGDYDEYLGRAALHGAYRNRVYHEGRKCPVHAAPYDSHRMKTAPELSCNPLWEALLRHPSL